MVDRDRLRDGFVGDPHPSRLTLDHPRRREILSAHDAAIERGTPTYRDPATGYSVFTARFLADRGYCCDSGCRHCPYVGARSSDPGPGEAHTSA